MIKFRQWPTSNCETSTLNHAATTSNAGSSELVEIRRLEPPFVVNVAPSIGLTVVATLNMEPT